MPQAAAITSSECEQTISRVAVSALRTSDVTYVSLKDSDPDLRSTPWCGAYQGPEAIVSTLIRVEQYLVWRRHPVRGKIMPRRHIVESIQSRRPNSFGLR